MTKRLFFIGMIIVIMGIGGAIALSNKQEAPEYKDISLKQFEKKVKDSQEFVVYVQETSCPACQESRPILNKVIKENDLEVFSLNIEKKENYDTSFLEEYNVDHVPTILKIKDGKEVNRIVGFHTENDYIKFLKEK